jgi:hypothetical protein
VGKSELAAEIHRFRQALDEHGRWLNEDYLPRPELARFLVETGKKLALYIENSRKYASGEKVRVSELERRRQKIEQTPYALWRKSIEQSRR